VSLLHCISPVLELGRCVAMSAITESIEG
jgi:hypothetical protein